jgi:hypothetical protein
MQGAWGGLEHSDWMTLCELIDSPTLSFVRDDKDAVYLTIRVPDCGGCMPAEVAERLSAELLRTAALIQQARPRKRRTH